MISLETEKDRIIAKYESIQGDDISWLLSKFENNEPHEFNKTFRFFKENLVKQINNERDPFNAIYGKSEPIDFIFALLEEDYFKVIPGVLSRKINIYLHKDIEKITTELFFTAYNISLVKKIDNLIDEDLYIGGNAENAISIDSYLDLIENFPNDYERKLYYDAKISSHIKNYFTTTKDLPSQFNKYLNKKKTTKGVDLTKTFKDFELYKNQIILKKLENMLADEINYGENQWQDEILQIILLLFPKYLYVFKETPLKTEEGKKSLDLLLVDTNGNVDIIEIKKPFENAVMTKNVYRNNYIPLRELSGTVMQIEKYIYLINRNAIKIEEELTKKYSGVLSENFKIKVTNPNGMIIMGRENKLSSDQKKDFEVVKRKYKNILDIITYDDLIKRLELSINQIKSM